MEEEIKQKRYWLRGCVIGALINPLIFIVFLFSGIPQITSPLTIPLAWLLINVMKIGLWGIPISMILGIILSGMVSGGLIGLIYGKIRLETKKTEN